MLFSINPRLSSFFTTSVLFHCFSWMPLHLPRCFDDIFVFFFSFQCIFSKIDVYSKQICYRFGFLNTKAVLNIIFKLDQNQNEVLE